ncbi:MAG: Mu transposase C-terminal domain-containing protein [Acidobacteria bacterium]|nr:Mu transposase C-terminal domain-containing protein [Acidobacteriota bacterium]
MEKKLASGEWQSRDSGARGRNGKAIREVLLTSLPSDLQWRWKQRQSQMLGLGNQITPDQDEGPAVQIDTLTKALTRFSPELREAYIAEVNRLDELLDRYDSINPKRARDAKGQLSFTTEVQALCREAICTNTHILAREPKRGKEPSPFTLDGWSRRRKSEGMNVFLRAAPTVSARDKRRAFISPDAHVWVEQNWRNHPTVTHLYDKLEKLAKKKRWQIPAIQWFYRRYNLIDPIVRTAVFKGDKAYTGKYKPFVPRTVEDIEALQMLCGDHHVLDVHSWNAETKLLTRLWLTVWWDMRLGLIWGSHIDVTPSSHTIACAYANGVRNFGAQPFSRPGEGFFSYLYTDNGRDYKSRNLGGEIEVHKLAARIDGGLQMLLKAHGVGLANDIDVKQFFARNYNGREKPVERVFRDLADAIQNEFFRRGWCGRSTSDRPDAWRDLYARHQKAVKRGQPSPFPAESDVRAYVSDWIHGYNTHAHTRTTLDGAKVVPLAEFNRLYSTRYQISDEALALMLMKPTQGALSKNGVRCLGSTYAHSAMSQFKGLKGEDGKALQLEVRYLDENYSTVWVVLPDGTFCEATRLDSSSVLTPNKETQRAVAQMIQHERRVIKDFQLITHSRLRGESVEDRVAVAYGVEQDAAEALPVAVNANPEESRASVQRLTRFDGRKLRAVPQPSVSSAEVSKIEADASIFGTPDKGRVSEFDFEE